MRYHALATDYDGTLAHHGLVDQPTIAALERLLASGRRLIMVTGRELPELLAIFPRLDLFELVVAENGALLYRPATKEEKKLADPPPEKFVQLLQERGVGPISVGRVIVATWEPHEAAVLRTIHDLHLELQVIFNKGAVMILPASVNKATGLKAALKELGISPHNVVGVGDAENDHAFLRFCEFSAAVANALPAVKDTADMVTPSDHGHGVTELIDAMVESDLSTFDQRLTRHHLPLGTVDDREVSLRPFGPTVLVSGASGSGKSTITTALLESLVERKYQFCVVDPEGDYQSFPQAAVLGGPESPPVLDEINKTLAKGDNAVVSLTGMPIAERPPFFLNLLPQLLQMRAKIGRPHWLVLDEVHHLLPAEWKPPAGVLPEHLYSTVLITVHPELLDRSILKRVSTIVAVGQKAAGTLASFAAAAEIDVPPLDAQQLEGGEALIWTLEGGGPPLRVKTRASKTERRRHRRKYAEGELPPERSFYFHGPEGKLNLRAQNLILFMQIADGLDNETWLHHLHNGDYARWFRQAIKDEQLAAEAERIAGLAKISPMESRTLMRTAIERDYTLPASGALPVPGAS
jgi:hydroxymethylpyrimidine pyrophosphatase-like HAD family hydrolase